jgi:hypothetical protein
MEKASLRKKQKMKVELTDTEHKILMEFLDTLNDSFNNAGCNDLYLVDTPENRELVANANLATFGKDAEKEALEVYAEDGEILTMDTTILSYIMGKIDNKKE